jgi:6-pyruvoyl-tetrahydropterin synthase
MIAHSFRGELFGPAQRLHGATYVVDVVFHRNELDDDGVVVDIGRARDALRSVLAELDYRNLDEMDRFRDQNTTTEYLARAIFDEMAVRVGRGDLLVGPDDLASMKVTLHESHVAWAAYEGSVSRPA